MNNLEKGVKNEEMAEVAHREQARFADGSSLAPTATTTTNNGSSKYASSTAGLEHATASKKAERRLVRKLGASPF
jgi:L-asparaginase II